MALWRIRATVDDRPGYLSVLTASLALRAVNILAVQVHTTEAGAVDDFLVDAPDTMSEADLLAAVAKGRGRDAFVARAEAQGLADQPTRALALAGRLVHDPEALGESLAALLDAREVRWTAGHAPGHSFTDTRMTLADPAGGRYDVTRRAPVFTPAEFARAQALVEVGGALVRRAAEQATLLLPDGAELLLRPATADDLGAVRKLHEACSAETIRRRYLTAGPAVLTAGPAVLTAGPAVREARLARLLEPAGGLTLLALHLDPRTGEERAVAMGSLLAEGDLGEVSVLVADEWQRKGVGTALLRRLVAFATRSELAAIVAHTASDNLAVLRTLRRIGEFRAHRDGPLVSVTLPLGDRAAASDEAPAAKS